MFIDKIILKNYRQYKEAEFDFSVKTNGGLHIIIGKMGIGKTNLFAAINWCLYGYEPKFEFKNGNELINKTIDNLPRLNINTLKESNEKDIKDVIVEVWITDNDGDAAPKNSTIVFRREEKYRILNKHKFTIAEEKFYVTINNPDSTSETYPDSIASLYVELFAPEDIREYFFFDGEKLDRFFKETSGQINKQAIYTISQIFLLEKVENTLKAINTEFVRETKRVPRVEELAQKRELLEGNVSNKKKEIDECDKQVKDATIKHSGLIEKLRGVPDIRVLNDREQELTIDLESTRKDYSKKDKDYKALIFKYGILFPLYPAIKYTLDEVEKKINLGQYPPTNDESLINNILKEKKCICGRSIGSEEESTLINLKERISIPSKIAVELIKCSPLLRNTQESILGFQNSLQLISDDKNKLELHLSKIDEEINKIAVQIKSYDSSVSRLYDEKDRCEEIIRVNSQKIGQLTSIYNQLKADYLVAKVNHEDAIKDESELLDLKKRIQFVENANIYLQKTKKDLIESIRSELITETKDMFTKLVWKNNLFVDIGIDENFNLFVYHRDGFKILTDVSGGEGEVLALSFVMALHEISGYKPPMVIDRPITMVSGETTDYVADVFVKISKNKQLILMFTPNDYEQIKNIIDPFCDDKYTLKMSEDSNECKPVRSN